MLKMENFIPKGLTIKEGIEVDGYGVQTVDLEKSKKSASKKQTLSNDYFDDILINPESITYDQHLPPTERLSDALSDFKNKVTFDVDKHVIYQSFITYLGLNCINDDSNKINENDEDEIEINDDIKVSPQMFLNDIPKSVIKFSKIYFDNYSYNIYRIQSLAPLLNYMISYLKVTNALKEFNRDISKTLDIIRNQIRNQLSPLSIILSNVNLGYFNQSSLYAFEIIVDAPTYGELIFMDDIEKANLIESEENTKGLGKLKQDQIYGMLRTNTIEEMQEIVQKSSEKVLGKPVNFNPSKKNLPLEVLIDLQINFDNANEKFYEYNNESKRYFNSLINCDFRSIYQILRIEYSVRRIVNFEKFNDDLYFVYFEPMSKYKSDRQLKTFDNRIRNCKNNIKHSFNSSIVCLWDKDFIDSCGGTEALKDVLIKAFYHQCSRISNDNELKLPSSWWIVHFKDVIPEYASTL